MDDPVIDPYTAKGRPQVISVVDLAINSRMIGLGSINVGTVGLRGSANKLAGSDGSIESDGQSDTVSKKPKKERWLPYPKKVRTRPEAVTRHFLHFLVHYTTLDTLLFLMSELGPLTIGNPRGCPGALSKFVNNNTFTSLPRLYPIQVPPIVVELVTTLGMAVGTWQGFSMGYHFFATLAVGSGLWETESWEIDFFNEPWNAESMLDLWGTRWHQLFRVNLIHLSNLKSILNTEHWIS